MAKMHSETIIFTVSQLLPNNTFADTIFDDDSVTALRSAIEEMVGSDKLVEVEVANADN